MLVHGGLWATLTKPAKQQNVALSTLQPAAAAALQVYDKMMAAGFHPTATTYTALISAYCRADQLDKALEVGPYPCRSVQHPASLGEVELPPLMSPQVALPQVAGGPHVHLDIS